jgi:flagellar motor switch protein FliN
MAETAVEEKTQQSDTEQQDAKTQVQSVELSETTETANTGAPGSIDILLDMSVPISASIGQTQITVRKLLQLGPGSVLKLDRPVDTPADLYLENAKFAAGSIVVVDGQFAIKIEKILGLGNPTENSAQA